MKILQNLDVQLNPFQNNESSVAGAVKAGQKTGNISSISGANLKGESLIQQRQGLAKKQALKVVSDAFG